MQETHMTSFELIEILSLFFLHVLILSSISLADNELII